MSDAHSVTDQLTVRHAKLSGGAARDACGGATSFQRHQARATMLVEHLRVVEATLRDGLEQVMGSYREGIEAAT